MAFRRMESLAGLILTLGDLSRANIHEVVNAILLIAKFGSLRESPLTGATFTLTPL